VTLSRLFKNNWTQRHRFGDWYSYTHSPRTTCTSRYSFHLLIRRNFQRRRTVDSGVDDQWQVDLIDLPNPKMFNNGHTFMLIVVEKFSNFAWAKLLKNKTGKSTLKRLCKTSEDVVFVHGQWSRVRQILQWNYSFVLNWFCLDMWVKVEHRWTFCTFGFVGTNHDGKLTGRN